MRRDRAGEENRQGDAGTPRRDHARDVLELREGQLRGILATASEGIITADQTQTIVMANRVAADMFRCSVGELVGAPLENLLPERFRKRHGRQLADFGDRESSARRMGQRAEIVGLRADGEEFALEAGISQVHVDGMRLYTVILRDLTGPRQAAAALRASEQMLAATFDVSSVGMAQVDPDTRRFVAVNAALCALSGYGESELLQMGPDHLNHPQDVVDPDKFAALLRGQAPYREEKRIVRKDGTVLWVQVTGSVVRGDDGRPQRVLGLIEDISARRAAEAGLRAREARQAFLVRLNDRLRELNDPRAIAGEASRLLGRFVGAARVGYAEDDGEEESIAVLSSFSDGVPEIGGPYRYRDYGSRVIRALSAGRTIVRADTTADPELSEASRAFFATGGVGAAVHVPLLREARLRALFFVHAGAPRDWTADEVSLFEDVARRLHADVERARAEAALRAREARQAFLVRLNDRLHDLDDAAAISLEAASLLGTFIGASRVGFAEDDGNGETLSVTRCHSEGVRCIEGRYRYRDHSPALLKAVRARRTLVRPDVAADPALAPAEKDTLASLQIGALIHVPLMRGPQLAGIFFVHAAGPRAWTPDEVALVQDVALRVRADVERARAEAGGREARATLEAALESMTDAVSISDAQGRFLQVNRAFVAFHRFDARDECLQGLAAQPPVLEVRDPDDSPTPPERWPAARALRGETGSNVEYGLRRCDTGARWIGAFSFAPIRDGQGRIAGCVVVGRDITALKRMHAELQASHMELQRLIDAQDQVAEGERLRIARELHDDLQQGLAAIAMQAAAIRQRLHGQDAMADRGLASIGRIGEQVIASTRRIIQDLRPQILEDLGLAAALEALASQFTQRSGIACAVDASGLEGAAPARVAPVASCLYRVAQEALNNVAKHAQARTVRIVLTGDDGTRVRLAVSDDGVGLPPGQAPAPTAFGLLGMRERVRAAGGHLQVRGVPGQGTTVEVDVPLPAAAEPPAH